MKAIALALASILTATAASATDPLSSNNPLSTQTWDQLRERMSLLNNISFLPSLLPVIMKNRDTLELTKQQVTALRKWRRENYQKMVDTMNAIIEKRIELSQQAVLPGVSGQELVARQDEIFALQRQVFLIRLSCRDLVTSTFTQEQWVNFEFIAADEPQIAGLFVR